MKDTFIFAHIYSIYEYMCVQKHSHTNDSLTTEFIEMDVPH